MRLRFPAGAGALVGLAAGIVLLSAQMALAGEPAAMTASGLKAVDSAGQTSGLEVVASDGELKPLEAAPIVRLQELPGYVAWDPGKLDPLTCLAQAIYFEARSESAAGQKAVAQVVMNRTHLPQYADTVCGVVYQGWERATGCQFTFVCDGSLRAPGDIVAWGRAVDIARKALAGAVYKPLLGATHYHAAWMTPYWAGGQLTRIGRIGGQIFYH